MKRNKTGYAISIGLLIILFTVHLPFLKANPDRKLCCSRDAFEAEGLSVLQVRNYINHGYLSFTEGDNLVKMPLFNLIIFPSFKIFGTQWIVARITVLVISILSLLLFLRISPLPMLMPVLCIVGLLQFHIFLFSHIVMSEMPAVLMILLSVGFLSGVVTNLLHKRKAVFLATLFCALAYWMKIQFVYLIPLVPLSLLCFKILGMNVTWRDIFHSCLWLILFLSLYFIIWYLPNRNFYNYILWNETADKFPPPDEALYMFYQNLRYNLFLPPYRVFLLTSGITLLAGIWEWFRTSDLKFKVLFISSSLWLMIECHKLFYAYLPPRYQVSLFFAAGLMASVVLCQLFFNSEKKIIRILAALIFMVFAVSNGTDYYRSYINREYSISDMNSYMKKAIASPAQVVVGSWAAAITWESRSRAIPVWNNFLNHENTLEKFQPLAIVAEADESDSDQLYRRKGVDLYSISDSIRHFSISRWQLNVYWLKQDSLP